MEIVTLPLEFNVIGVQHNFGSVREAQGSARVEIVTEDHLGIPIVHTMVTFDFDGDGRPFKAELTEVEGDVSGTPVKLLARWGWDRHESYGLFIDPIAMAKAKKSHIRYKEEMRKNKERLRWSDENPALSSKEASMPIEERRRLTREERRRLGDQSSPVWRAYAGSILGLSPESSSISFEACPFCVERHVHLQEELNKK